jgi:hypothetical protein
MRRLCLCTCLGVVLFLPLNSTTQADIAPIARPDAPKKLPTTKPKPKPKPHPAAQPRQSAIRRSVATSTRPSRKSIPAPVVSTGGRKKPPFAPAVSRGGRTHPALPRARIAEIVPTRLSEAGKEALRSYEVWPSWLLAVLALLASAEAFLLLRLARSLPVGSPAALGAPQTFLAAKPTASPEGPPQSRESA